MTSHGYSLYDAIEELASSVEDLGVRAKATIFGACAHALAPLLKEAGRRIGRDLVVPEFDVALASVDAFVVGAAEVSDQGALRSRLLSATPHGHDAAAPWSTFAQDAIICVDAALAAASIDGQVKPIWIQYALEPHMAMMQTRDVELIRSRGDDHWALMVMEDPKIEASLTFLRNSIATVVRNSDVGQEEYQRMIGEAAVLRPEINEVQR